MGNLLKRPICACCDKPYGKRDTETKIVRWRPSLGQTMPAYDGNLKVVSIERKPAVKEHDDWRGHDDDAQWAKYRLWNGTYWSSGYDPFCTLRCALRFAQAAHRAGYTLKRKKV